MLAGIACSSTSSCHVGYWLVNGVTSRLNGKVAPLEPLIYWHITVPVLPKRARGLLTAVFVRGDEKAAPRRNGGLSIIASMILVDRIARIRIELKGVDPAIWRRVEIPLTASLKGLHDVIQAVMPFEHYHLFRFEVGGKRYGISDPQWDHVRDTLDAKNIRVGTLVERGARAFSYTYDFGDDWRHSVTIEDVATANPKLEYPRFIDGSRRGPPEDVGGIPGFEEFLDAMADPRHPEHQRLTQWYGSSFDPDDLNLPVINDRIGKLAKRRAFGKAGYAKSRGLKH